jgi:signal transduction histidine kinase
VIPTERSRGTAAPGWRAPTQYRQLGLDVLAMVIGALDVLLVIPPKAQPYSIWLSALACLALALRRKFPFLVTLVTVPGFLAGWAELAAMIALGTLARRRLLAWQTLVAAALVATGRVVRWPLDDFMAATWREHALDGVYACFVAGMPIAIGLLAHAREQLSARVAELADSRERERRFYTHVVRAEERAKLAREMHDVVSHQVSLIAMQAGALRVTAADPDAQRVAGTIRELSTRTLEELRQLVGVLRTTDGEQDEPGQPGLAELPDLVRHAGVAASLTTRGPVPDLPAPVSGAVYRTVQEALTNIGKHAPGSAASVLVAEEAGTVLVEVRNEPPHDTEESALPSGGHGLVGLRERATLLGGSFQAGPTPEGGFLVRASFPVRATS